MSHGAIQLMVYEELKSLAVHRGGTAAEQRAQRAHVAAWRRRQQEGGSSGSSGSGDAAGEAEGPWGFRRRDAEEAVSCAPDAARACDATPMACLLADITASQASLRGLATSADMAALCICTAGLWQAACTLASSAAKPLVSSCNYK